MTRPSVDVSGLIDREEALICCVLPECPLTFYFAFLLVEQTLEMLPRASRHVSIMSLCVSGFLLDVSQNGGC